VASGVTSVFGARGQKQWSALVAVGRRTQTRWTRRSAGRLAGWGLDGGAASAAEFLVASAVMPPPWLVYIKSQVDYQEGHKCSRVQHCNAGIH